VDETVLKLGGRGRYSFRGLDEHGQIGAGSLSDHRAAASARAGFARTRASSDVAPTRITSAKANGYSSALRPLRPTAEHGSSKDRNTGLERDQPVLQGRVRPLRRFQATATASTVCRGHALSRNRARGFAGLAPGAASRLRLVTAWTALALRR
jgi:transposase-like protein